MLGGTANSSKVLNQINNNLPFKNQEVHSTKKNMFHAL